MRVTFIGHACALLEFSAARVLTDPYSTEIGGYEPVNLEVDLVTISHSNPKWHSCLDDVRGPFSVYEGLNALGKVSDAGTLQLEAVRVFERLHSGQTENTPDGGEGPNAMIKISGDSVSVLHMGDVGHALSAQTLQSCGNVDVLLAPVGGEPTIMLEDLIAFTEALQPQIVIPIHYGVPKLNMSLLSAEVLAERWNIGDIKRHTDSTLDVSNLLSEGTHRCELHLLPPLRQKTGI